MNESLFYLRLVAPAFLSILYTGAIVYFIWKVFSRKHFAALALSRFSIETDSEPQIVIEGRNTGLMQWASAQFNLANMYRIHIRKEYISYSEDSARGEILTLIPVRKIASTSCGFCRPVGLLIIAIIAFLLSFIGAVFINGGGILLVQAIIIDAILVAFYVFGKKFYVSIQTTAGDTFGFSFKRSYIENGTVNIEKVKEAINRINALILDSQ
jgi:hypothetical protein